MIRWHDIYGVLHSFLSRERVFVFIPVFSPGNASFLYGHPNLSRSSYSLLFKTTSIFNSSSLQGTATVEQETFQRSLLSARIANDAKKKANGSLKKAENPPPVNIGWDSHTAVVSRL